MIASRHGAACVMACVLLAVLGSSTPSLACTREQAFNRMMALNQYNMKLQASLPDPLKDPAGFEAARPRVTEFATRLGAVGKTLADQKYDAACAAYDALAHDYAVDIAAQGVRPLSALEAEAKHPPSAGCDLAEASRRSVALVEAFRRRAQAEHLDRDAWQRFGKDNEPIGLAIQQDPRRACELVDEVARRYDLSP